MYYKLALIICLFITGATYSSALNYLSQTNEQEEGSETDRDQTQNDSSGIIVEEAAEGTDDYDYLVKIIDLTNDVKPKQILLKVDKFSEPQLKEFRVRFQNIPFSEIKTVLDYKEPKIEGSGNGIEFDYEPFSNYTTAKVTIKYNNINELDLTMSISAKKETSPTYREIIKLHFKFISEKPWDLFYNNNTANDKNVNDLTNIHEKLSNVFTIKNNSKKDLNLEITVSIDDDIVHKIENFQVVKGNQNLIPIESSINLKGKKELFLEIKNTDDSNHKAYSFDIKSDPSLKKNKFQLQDEDGQALPKIIIKETKHKNSSTKRVYFVNNTKKQKTIILNVKESKFENGQIIFSPDIMNKPITISSNSSKEITLQFNTFYLKDNSYELSFIDEAEEKYTIDVLVHRYRPIFTLKYLGFIVIFLIIILFPVLYIEKMRKSNALENLTRELDESMNKLKPLSADVVQKLRDVVSENYKGHAEKASINLERLTRIAKLTLAVAWERDQSLDKMDEEAYNRISKKISEKLTGDNRSYSDIDANRQTLCQQLKAILSAPQKGESFDEIGKEPEISEDEIVKRVEALKMEDDHMEGFLNKLVKAFHCQEVARAGRTTKRSAVTEQLLDVHLLLRYLREKIPHSNATIKSAHEQLVRQNGQISAWYRYVQETFSDISNQNGSSVQDILGRVQKNRQQIQAQLKQRDEEKKILLHTLDYLNQALHFSLDTKDLEHAGPAVLVDTLQFLKHKEPLLPDYVVQFRDMARTMAEDLTHLQKKLPGYSDFRKLLDIAVSGPNQNTGPTKMVQIIGVEGDHKDFIALLGLEHPEQLRSLEKSLFFRKLVRPLFMPSVNAFFQLYLYKDIRHNGVAVLDDFRSDNLDVAVLERVHTILRGGMQWLFDMDLIAVRLFEDRFDAEKHVRANEPTLIKLPRLGKKYYAMLSDLGPNVVYDLSEIGFRSPSLQLDVKPRVIPHNP